MNSNIPKLWFMNGDFEFELAALSRRTLYRQPPAFTAINRRLTQQLVRLMNHDNALLIESDEHDDVWLAELERVMRDAGKNLSLYGINNQQDVYQIIAANDKISNRQIDRNETSVSGYAFTPWGWTPRVMKIGVDIKARIAAPPLEVVAQVNSKLYSFQLEQEFGTAMPEAAAARNLAELEQHLEQACPHTEDKWVIKSVYGFAARERVLGRGAQLAYAARKWCERRFANKEILIFQPWLQVVREYGVAIMINPNGAINVLGVSDLQTNGAGTGKGYLLGRKIPAPRRQQLYDFAVRVGKRLHKDGYFGACGIDALEHADGWHPLLEINARYTMGFIALAIEHELNPPAPVFWSSTAV